MKKVTTPLKPVIYRNHLGQLVKVQQQIDAQKAIKTYEKRKHYWSQFEPNTKARK